MCSRIVLCPVCPHMLLKQTSFFTFPFSQLFAFSQNPLLAIFPNTGLDPSIPLPVVFTLLSLLIHLNFVLFFNSDEIRFFTSDEIRTGLQLSDSLTPLTYQLLYPLSAVAPTLSLVLGKPWQTTVWWLITPAVIFIVQTVIEAIQQSIHGIDRLENMKYTAPGV